MIFGPSKPERKAFAITTKKIEWMLAAGRDPEEYTEHGKFFKTSYCRVKSCRRKLTWGDRSYDFDHKDNNPANNRQSNCFLVCKSCHGKATKLEKQKVRGLLGGVIGHKTIKRKVSYKKPKSTVTKKKTTARRTKR